MASFSPKYVADVNLPRPPAMTLPSVRTLLSTPQRPGPVNYWIGVSEAGAGMAALARDFVGGA